MGAKGSKPGAPTPVAGAPVAPNAPVAPVAMATNAGGQLNITKRSTYQTFKNSVKGRVMGTGTTGDARAQLAKAVASGNGNLVDPGVLRAAIQSGANIEGIINTPLIAPYRTFDFARKLTRVDVFKLLFAGKEYRIAACLAPLAHREGCPLPPPWQPLPGRSQAEVRRRARLPPSQIPT